MKSNFKKIIVICSVMILALGVSLPAYAEPDGEKTISPSQSKNANCQNPKKFTTDSGDVIEEAVYGEELEEINIDGIQAAYKNKPDVEKTIIPPSNPVRK